MTALGIHHGLRCLQVGAGGGSVAAWLCEQVGPTGRVVATDINIQLLQDIRQPNFEAVKHDITVDSPPESDFDIVHSRWLLHYLPKPARAIHVAVRLGLPDLLGNGPKRLSELALATNSNEPAVHRLLRCLKHLGIVTEISPEFYSGTSLSERLQRDRSDSFYWLSMLYGDEWQLRAWERFEDSIRTGRSGMSCAYGTDLWTYLDQHPDSAELYNKPLSGLSALNDQVAKTYEFPESAVVIDIGGGQGDFLRRILARNSTLRGVLFDRKSVIDSAGIGDDPSCHDRLSLIAGDFFQSIPPDGNIYVLEQVLHDWDDPRATAILQSCRRVMTPGRKLLIVELIIPEAGPAALLGSLIDLHMLVMHSGRERTADEFSRLCGAAGFKLTRVVATGTPICIIEGVPI